MNVLYVSQPLAQCSLLPLPSLGTGRREPWERGCMFRSVGDQFTCKSKRCQGLTVNFSIAVPLLQRFAEQFFAYPKNIDCSKLAEAKVIKLSLWLPSFQVCPFPPLAPPPPSSHYNQNVCLAYVKSCGPTMGHLSSNVCLGVRTF